MEAYTLLPIWVTSIYQDAGKHLVCAQVNSGHTPIPEKEDGKNSLR